MIDLDLDANGDARVLVGNLVGQALDFWVCKCLGQDADAIMALPAPPAYSSDYAIGGPFVEAHKIAQSPEPPDMIHWVCVWPRPANKSRLVLPQSIQQGAARVGARGRTPLIAAARAFVGGIAGPQLLLPAKYHEAYRREFEAEQVLCDPGLRVTQ